MNHPNNYKTLNNQGKKPITFMLWNACSLTHTKTVLLKSRYEDVMIINETWLKEGKTIEVKGYNTIVKNREVKMVVVLPFLLMKTLT